MKKLKHVLMSLMVCTMGVTACTSTNSNNNTNNNQNVSQNVISQTAVEKLSVDEKGLYDAIVNSIYDFKDPSSVQVVSIPCQYWNSAIEVTLQAKNSYGSFGSTKYLYFYKDITITSNDMAMYSSATKLNDGTVKDPSRVIGSVRQGQFISYDYITSFIDEFDLLTFYDVATDAKQITYQLYRFKERSGDSLTTDFNVGRINNALTEFKSSQGWN